MQHAASLLKQRKFYLLLPAIVCPFLVLLFWILGGGKGAGAMAAITPKGLNLQLPDANVKAISALDKLSFYALAKQDSVKRHELEQLDPAFATMDAEDEWMDVAVQPIPKLYQPSYRSLPTVEMKRDASSEEMEQLEAMVTALQQPKTDQELELLQQTVQQLIALQAPKDSLRTMTFPSSVLAVSLRPSIHASGFFGESVQPPDSSRVDLIRAVVHGEQVVQQSAVIKLRLLQDVFIQSVLIPAGSFLFGLASIDQERLQIQIQSIPFQGHLYPVALRVLDLDGIAGLSIPGSATREVVKQSAEQSVQSIGLLAVNPSLQAQAAAAGIGTAKQLLGRKIRQVRVTLKSGHQVFLQDQKREGL